MHINLTYQPGGRAVNRSELSLPCRETYLAAWHYQATGEAPRPCIIMAPGFGLVRTARLPAYAERFCEAGFDVLLFDYRYFGASGGEPRQLLSYRAQIEDWKAVVEHARALPLVDPDKILLWGTSFSGGHVLVTAARDPRIAAVVAQIPFVDAVAVIRSLGMGTVLRLTLAAMRDIFRMLTGRDAYRVPITGRPGEPAALPVSGASEGYRRLVGEDATWNGSVTARVFMWLPLYRPVRLAAKIRCPLLVQVAEGDTLTPCGPAIRAAAGAPRGVATTYPGGHFDLYFDETFEAAVGEQIAFLWQAAGMGEVPAKR
jgi:uncharacterized protein